MSSLLIRGGTLVTPQGAAAGDVLIEGQTITEIGPQLPRAAARQVVDADGLLVLPGLVDTHVHLREPGDTHKEDFTSGTGAALAGGFTTVLAMPNTHPPVVDRKTFAETARLAAAKALCDIALFVGATPGNAVEAAEITQAAGLKVYMAATTGDLLVTDIGPLLAHFGTYPRQRILAVHAEDAAAVEWFGARGQGRPTVCALLALARALTLARHFRRRLHVCHVSTGGEVALIRAARSLGVSVTCEVTPHHLFLTTADARQLGPHAHVHPPLRSPAEADGLWASLAEVDCVATDHAPHTVEEKRGPQVPAGLPGLETALPLLLTASLEGRLSLREVGRLLGQGPAAAFGLARKGHLAPGNDADVVLVDLEAEWTVGERPLVTRCGWSPFAGRRLNGRVERVFLRGRLAYDASRILCGAGSGQLLGPAGKPVK